VVNPVKQKYPCGKKINQFKEINRLVAIFKLIGFLTARDGDWSLI
jgi:hypothetical protein